MEALTQSNGFNPIRWDCKSRGCFNQKQRPKIEIFCDLFPGKISFGDIDGIVEVNGFGLVIEWKGVNVPVPRGQQIMWERLTRSKMLTALVVSGDPESMVVDHVSWFYSGTFFNGKPCDMAELRKIISKWVSCAQSGTMP